MNFKELFKLFITFFKIGLFTIGGGLVMIPIMHREFVLKQKWVSDEKMTDILTVSQSLPGVIAINSSVYVGYELYGLKGAVIASIGVVLPSFLCILAIYFTISGIGDNVYLEKFYTGVRAAVVGLIAVAAIKLSKSAVKDVFGVLIAIFGIIATVLLKIDIVVMVCISGFAAYIFYTVKERHIGGS